MDIGIKVVIVYTFIRFTLDEGNQSTRDHYAITNTSIENILTYLPWIMSPSLARIG